MNIYPIIVETSLGRRLLLVVLMLLSLAMSILFMVVDKGSMIWLGVALLIFPVSLLWFIYLSWYSFEIYENHLLFKRLNKVHELDCRYITSVKKSFWGQKIEVQMGASTESFEFYLWPSEYIRFYAVMRFTVPAYLTEYELKPPYLFEFKYAKLHPFIVFVGIGCIWLTGAFWFEHKEPLDMKTISSALVCFCAGCWFIYAFFYQLKVALLFEEEQVTIINRWRKVVVAAAQVGYPNVDRKKDYSTHGAIEYINLELKLGDHIININTNDTDIPLTILNRFILDTYIYSRPEMNEFNEDSEGDDYEGDENMEEDTIEQ